MSEQQTQQPAEQTQEQARGKKAKKPQVEVDRSAFGSVEEAQGAKPAGEHNYRIFRVTSPDGRHAFTWALGNHAAAYQAIKALGWSVVEEGKAPSADKVTSLLNQLTPEQRAAVLAQFNGPAPTLAPAADKQAKGKGK